MKKGDNMEDSVKRILDLCEASGITKTDLCRKIDIPPTTFSNYVIRGGKPNYDMLKKISSVFGVSVAYLDSGEEPTFNIENEVSEIVNRVSALPEETQKKVLSLIYQILGTYEK